MSHSARQSKQESQERFIDNLMDDLLASTDNKKMDFICDLVYEGRVDIDDLMAYCDEEARDYYGRQWRPR